MIIPFRDFYFISKIKILISAILFFTSLHYSQQWGSLRGFVTDSTSGEALLTCNVYLSEIELGASTDQRGFYFINKIPANKNYTVTFSYIGYKSKTINVRITPNRITELNVELVPSSLEFQEVEKIGQRITKQDQFNIGIERITLKDIYSKPQTVEADVLRLLKTIPGVTSTGDISAKYYVRGGTGDQNLVKLNGVSLYNPFHALGLFSVVDADMVNSIEFHKGEFPAKYGGRISSIMKVATKDGNRNKFSSTASANLMTGKLLIEGPYKFGSFILTGRKSYSTSILKKFLNDDDVPVDFYDFSFKANYTDQNFLKNGRFTVFGFFSGDNFDDPKPRSDDFKWGNDLLSFEWVQIYDKPFFSRFQFSYSNFKGEIIPNDTDVKPRFNSLKDFTFDAEFSLVRENKDQFTVGLEFKTVKTELEQENENSSLIKLSDFGGSYVLYSNYELLQFDDFGIDAGLRMYMTGLSLKGGFSIEPRVKGFWQPSKTLILKASAGSYRQEIATITDENEVISLFDPWTIYPDYLEATKSINLSFGAEYFYLPSSSISVEVYYRKIKNLALINEKKIFPDDPALINGDGRAYGIENSLTFETNQFSFNASYTLSWAFKKIDDFEYSPKYDSRHNVNLAINYILGDNWEAGISWAYNSGFPFTPLRGYFDRYELSDFFDYDPAFDRYSIYTILGERNVKRMPDYHRLDIALSKIINFDFATLELSASIINVYDRKNLFYFKRDTGEKVNMLPFLPTASIKVKF